MEKFEGYKTFMFFALVLVVQVANLLGFADFALSAEQQNLIAVLVPFIGLILRKLTKTPLFGAKG